MVTVFFHSVGRNIDDLKPELGELGDFNVGSEARCEQSQLVAFVQQEILLQRLEGVTHSGCRAFGGEKIIYSLVILAAHRPAEIVADHHLGIFQRARRSGIMVSEDSIYHFKDEIIGINAVGGSHVVIVVFQHFSPVIVLVGFDEVKITFGATVLRRRGDYPYRSVEYLSFGLGGSEETEKEESLAGTRQKPVGVATAGIEECGCRTLRVFFSQTYQSAFYFKRTHFFQSALISAVFGISGCIHIIILLKVLSFK